VVHEAALDPGEPLGQLLRVGDRRAGEDEARLGPVRAGQAAKAAQHVAHVRAEHTAVHVRLVHHDPGEVREHVAPLAVVRQDPDVEHVRVREDQVRARADRPALGGGRVAVVDRVAQERRLEAGELARLVLGERLGRVEVEGAGAAVAGERVEHRQVECERLAAGGAGRHDRVALERGGERLGLVGVELVDAVALERLEKLRVEVAGEVGALGRAGAEATLVDDLLAAARLDQAVPRGFGSGDGHPLR
jgi:hypothetical protein